MKNVGKFIIYLILFTLLLTGFHTIFITSGGSVIEKNGILFLGLLILLGIFGWSKSWGERLFYFVSIFSLSYLVLLWYLRNNLYLVLFIITLIIYLMALPKKCGRKITLQEQNSQNLLNFVEEPHSMVFNSPDENNNKNNNEGNNEGNNGNGYDGSKVKEEKEVKEVKEVKEEKKVKEVIEKKIVEKNQSEKDKLDLSNKSDETEVEKNFSPGKYVGSSNGTVFHAPTCNWAKKIAESRQTWFNSDEEAVEKGYKKHNCVK